MKKKKYASVKEEIKDLFPFEWLKLCVCDFQDGYGPFVLDPQGDRVFHILNSKNNVISVLDCRPCRADPMAKYVEYDMETMVSSVKKK